MKLKFYHYPKVEDSKLKYVLIFSMIDRRKWILVRHRERTTWEIPAGHIEKGERPIAAAKRELYEETGVVCYSIVTLFDYSVKSGLSKNYGRVFWADVEKLGELPLSEIAEVRLFDDFPDNLTYREIQLALLGEVKTKMKGVIC